MKRFEDKNYLHIVNKVTGNVRIIDKTTGGMTKSNYKASKPGAACTPRKTSHQRVTVQLKRKVPPPTKVNGTNQSIQCEYITERITMEHILEKIILGAMEAAITDRPVDEIVDEITSEITGKKVSKRNSEEVKQAVADVEQAVDDEILIELKHKNGDEKYSVKLIGTSALLLIGARELLEKICMNAAKWDKILAIKLVHKVCSHTIESIMNGGNSHEDSSEKTAD